VAVMAVERNVAAPSEQVWAIVSDLDRSRDVISGIIALERTDGARRASTSSRAAGPGPAGRALHARPMGPGAVRWGLRPYLSQPQPYERWGAGPTVRLHDVTGGRLNRLCRSG